MDISRLKRIAKTRLDEGSSRIKRWWCKKYNRPPNDPLFEEKTVAEHLEEMYGDLYSRKEDLEEELKNSSSNNESVEIMKNLSHINRILEEEDSEDPFSGVEEWEAALDRGEEPDF